MTATERLRALLDERGVEWRDDSSIYGTRRTVWTADGVTYVAAEVSGRLKVSGYLTPEQAIAATLGAGTCHDANVGGYFVCSECEAHVKLHSIGRSYVDKFGKRWYSTSNEHGLNFCPNCGKRIEVDDVLRAE